MPKQPSTTNTDAKAKATIFQQKFAVGKTAATKNYTILEPQNVKDVATGKPAILIGNNGVLYVRTDLMPKDGGPLTLSVTTA